VSTFWRTLGGRLARDIAAVSLAVAFVGLSFGAIATATGLPPWAVVAFSLFVFAGGSQFVAVALVAAGNPVAAIVGGLLLNARHLPFGMALADVLATGWPRRLLGTHLMVDEAVAFSLAQPDPARRRAAYWFTGVTLFTGWQIGTIAGIAIGEAVGDPAQYGLDAAFPAALIALILPRLREPAGRRVALVAAVVAVAATFLVPPGLPVLLGLVGLLAAGRLIRRGGPEPTTDGDSGPPMSGPPVPPTSGPTNAQAHRPGSPREATS
jgi:4-azaleucine resistance transporter AzlC